LPVRIVHQTGAAEHEAVARDFAAAGIAGEVVPFIKDMATAFAEADLVVGRAGAGGVTEIAAAGMAAILIPLPFAADDHQRENARTLVDAGAARMILDAEMTGERLFREVEELRAEPETLASMRQKVRQFARPGAAERAAAVLEEAAQSKRRS
jgi:UDP-N-acetylglucosamine--N-acetylmuramyl-(pentapeptide) pyrophosphoryl-undecaprenol N-acetylglucosamine transferase